MLDLQFVRIGEGRDKLGWQSSEVEVAAEPGFRHLEPLGHVLLLAAVVAAQRLQIVAGPLDVAEVVPRPVFQVGDPEGFLVGEFANLHEISEVGVVMLAQPADRPMPACPRDDLEVDARLVLHPADDRRKLLPTLRLEAFDQVRAAVLIELCVVAIVLAPDPAARRIDLLDSPPHHGAGRELGHPALPARQDAGRQPGGRLRLGPRIVKRAHQARGERAVLGGHRRALSPEIATVQFCVSKVMRGPLSASVRRGSARSRGCPRGSPR